MVIFPRWQVALGFVTRALFSTLATLIEMSAAERANVKTATVARTSSGKALVTQVRGGAIIGLSITSLILIGITLLYFLFGADPTNKEGASFIVGFGANLSALFAARAVTDICCF